MDLIALVCSQNMYIDFKGEKLKYLKIAHFRSIDFSFGICEKGWFLNDSGASRIVPWEEKNFISFIKLLELPFDELIHQIENGIDRVSDKKDDIPKFFPIVEMTRTAFYMESSYWSSLSLDFLYKGAFYLTELNFLKDFLDKKWLTQELRHKLQRYLSRIRVY